MEWRQERPSWCPHVECRFAVRSQDSICIGELPTPAPHDGDVNTHRMCQRGAQDDGLWLHQLELNRSDAWHFSRCLRVAFHLTPEARADHGAQE